MKPYQPYKEDAFFTECALRRYAITFRGVQYRDTTNETALGVLLFGLRPAGFNFHCKSDPSAVMHLAQHAAYILHLHANGERFVERQRRISDDDLRRWVALAVDLAPDVDSAEFVRQCIDHALGPFAYLGDEELRIPAELRETARDLHKAGVMTDEEFSATAAASSERGAAHD
jgi:hypothetical protein